MCIGVLCLECEIESVCLCVCACMCLCVYVCMYVFVCVCMYVDVYVCMCIGVLCLECEVERECVCVCVYVYERETKLKGERCPALVDSHYHKTNRMECGPHRNTHTRFPEKSG